MRHRKNGLKLNMTSSHRTAMFRNMVTSLLKHEKIQTTSTRAKELRGWADHLITLAKRGDLHARRQALSIVREKSVVHKLFDEAAERFGLIAGGYTRVIKIGLRPGDAAPMSLIQLVAEPSKKPQRKDKTDKKTDAAVKKTEIATAPTVQESSERDKAVELAPADHKAESNEKVNAASVPKSMEETKEA
jgi:large subunit ribosomal protein L17